MKDKIINAIYFTLENAKSLFEEAQILKENKKFARAYALYHLSFEECGRLSMLHDFFTDYVSGELTVRDLNYGNLKKRGFERHDEKVSQAFIGQLFLGMVKINQENSPEKDKKTEEFTNSIMKLMDHSQELNRLKNASLYVSFNENEFHSPEDSITYMAFKSMELLATTSLKTVSEIVGFIEAKGGFENLKKVYEEELKNYNENKSK